MSRQRRITTRIGDGQAVVIRPIRPNDKDALRDGLLRLSPESRYRRFMAPIKDFSESQLRYLTEVDYRNHMAWVAFSLTTPSLSLGVARYVRDAEQADVAEAAVTVVDSHQNLGLGTLLLRQLAYSARRNGITRFRGYVLQDNAPMLRMLSENGATIEAESPGVLRIETDIPLNVKDLARTSTSSIFRAVAQRSLPPLAVRFLHDEVSRVVKMFSSETKPDVPQADDDKSKPQ